MGKTEQFNVPSQLTPTYGRALFRDKAPTHTMPEQEHDPKAVYRFIRDELQLDGNPTLNMASFVTTVMDDEANQLIGENLGKNYIDGEVYNRTLEIEQRCVRMLLDLYKAPHNMASAEQLADRKNNPVKSGWGTVAIGSSEALMLCALSHKEQWKKNRKGHEQAYRESFAKWRKANATELGFNDDTSESDLNKPNIILGSDVHITWVKFAQYFDLDIIWVPITKESNYVVSVDEIKKRVNANTTCVVGVMGTSYTGQNDPVKDINDALVAIKNDRTRDIAEGIPLNVPLHVDGASGGFIEPFRDYNSAPYQPWDFSLEQVKTINVSGHKFGLVYPGVGWALWKDINDIPDKLFVTTNVLGFDESTYSLNFSRGSSMVLAQYYNFLRLGKSGYSAVVQNLVSLAQSLSTSLASLRLTVIEYDKDETGQKVTDSGKAVFTNVPVFKVINNGAYFPASAVRLNLTYTSTNTVSPIGEQVSSNNDINNYPYSVHNISDKVKQDGWVVPAFTMPLEKFPPTDPRAQDDTNPKIAVMRMVIKEGLSHDMLSILVQSYIKAITKLEVQTRTLTNPAKVYEANVEFDKHDEASDAAKVVNAILEKAGLKAQLAARQEIHIEVEGGK